MIVKLGVFCYVESFGVLLKSELDNHYKNLDLSKGRLHPCYGGTVVPALGDSQVGWTAFLSFGSFE